MNENRWEQAGAAAGIVFVALILASIFIVPAAPHINASFLNIANYYVSNRGGLLTSALLGTLGSVFFLWFVSHLRHLLQLMQRYTRLKESAAEDDVGLALVADAEIFRLEAVVRWLDSADVRLRRFPDAAPGASSAPAAARRTRRTVGGRR